MSYTGIIHRQDTDTGVTLRAKAVTPNKMKAAVKNYKVTVKKNPESSYQKALDLQAIIKNGIASLIGNETERDDYSDIDFSALINDSTVITIINKYPTDPAVGTLLSQCYNEKGVLVATPKINEPNAEGTIKFTTTITGDDGKTATVSFSQDVVIKAKDYHDLLNKYTAKFAWNKIYRNQEGNSTDWKASVDTTPIFLNHNIQVPGVSDSSTNPTTYLAELTSSQNVISPTEEEFTTGAKLFPELGAGKVFIRTEIVDDLKAGTSTSIFAADRLSNSGTLGTAPAYTTVYEYLNDSPNADMEALINPVVSSVDNQVQAHYIMRGLKIKSTLYMGILDDGTYKPDVTKKVEVIIPLETTSGYLTNQQVFARMCEDDNFKLQIRSSSYDGTSLKAVATAGVLSGTGANRITLDLEGADVYARFPNSQAAGVVGIDGKIFDDVPVQFQITGISAKAYTNGALEDLTSTQKAALLGSNIDADDCFAILEASDVEGSVANSWRGAVFTGSATDELVEQPITFIVTVNVSSYAVDANATTFSNTGASSQTRYLNFTITTGTAE